MKKMKKDDLGNRIKSYEKKRTNEVLAYKSYYIYARLDGRGFSKLTKHADRPFDITFIEAMNHVTEQLMKGFNADIAYVQSDEISLGWKITPSDSEFIFNGKIQKITSLMAAKASVLFYKFMANSTDAWAERVERFTPTFDCRVFEVPSAIELYNCFEWRYQDASRNFVSQWARAYCSHKELNNLSKREIVKLMNNKGHQVNERSYRERFGLFFYKTSIVLINSKNEQYYTRKVIEFTSFNESKDFQYKKQYFAAILGEGNE